jgi:hypothetical protein
MQPILYWVCSSHWEIFGWCNVIPVITVLQYCLVYTRACRDGIYPEMVILFVLMDGVKLACLY